MAFGFAAAIPNSRFSLRAERSTSGALDFSSSSSSSSAPDDPVDGKRRFVFVVNPNGANGRTGREWKKLLPYLQSRLRGHCNIQEHMTSGPSHATDITREAIREGADAVIAVGGDGTLHEVINGYFWDGKPVMPLGKKPQHSTALGLIPLGTGSDFARTFGWRNDPNEAIERITRGIKSKFDVGVATSHSGEVRYFINDTDMHLSAKAGYYASKYKVFGNLCYVFGALRAFMSHQNRDLKIKINEEEWEIFHNVTALCIGNGKYFGGGMKIAPTADPRSGTLEVVILQDFKWYDFILKLHKLYSGLHVSEKNVHVRSVKSVEVIEVLQKGGVYVQTDGEHIGFLPVKCSIMPAAVEFFI